MSYTEEELRAMGATPPETPGPTDEERARLAAVFDGSEPVPADLKAKIEEELGKRPAIFWDVPATAQRFDELVNDVCSLTGCRPEAIQSIEYRPSDRQVNVLLMPTAQHVEVTIVKAEPEPTIRRQAEAEELRLRNQGRPDCQVCRARLPLHHPDCPAG